jgi:hypothetical protein
MDRPPRGIPEEAKAGLSEGLCRAILFVIIECGELCVAQLKMEERASDPVESA